MPPFSRNGVCREHLREFPLEMIFNIVYHAPGAAVSAAGEGSAEGAGGLSIEVQMAWGGSSTYTFQARYICFVLFFFFFWADCWLG